MKLYKILILAFFAVTLIACGGAEERKSVYMEKAKASMEAGDLDKARIELKNVLQIDPKDAEAYYQLGKIFEKQNEYRKAFSNYQKSAEINPLILENQARLGRFYLLLANEIDKAQEKIDFILSKEPDNSEGLLLKAVMMMKKGDKNEAVDLAKMVVSREPGSVDGAAFLATLYFKEGESKKAIAVLDDALNVNYNNEQLNKLLALILMKNKEYDRAEIIYKGFLDKNPNASVSYNNLAAFYSQMNNKDKVEEVLRASIDNDPDDVERQITLAKYIKDIKGNAEAIKTLQELIGSNPDSGKLRVALGQLFVISGDKKSAVAVYKKAISDFSDEEIGVESRILLASIYLSDKKYSNAREILDQALEVSPNDPKVNYLRARLAYHDGDVEKAIIALRVVTKEMPENMDAYLLLVSVYQSEGNKEQVESVLNTAYANNKINPEGLLKLSEFYLKRDMSQAEKIIDDYNNIRNDDYDGVAIKAAILNQKKSFSGAYELATKLMELYPKKPAGYFQAVPHLLQLGEKQQAISVLEKGYVNAEDNRRLLVLLTRLQVSDKNFKLAGNRIENELNASPGDIGLKVLLAKVYMAGNDLMAAKSLLNDTLQSEPGVEEAYLLLAQVYKSQKDLNALVRTLEKARVEVPSSTKIILELASVYEENNEYSKAIDLYRDIYKRYPDNMVVINNLASLLSDYASKGENFVLMKSLAGKLETREESVFLDTAGWAYFKLGDFKNAIQYLLDAVEKSPKIKVFNYHLGMAYKMSGDNKQAKTYLEKSLADGKYFKEKDLARQALKDL